MEKSIRGKTFFAGEAERESAFLEKKTESMYIYEKIPERNKKKGEKK